MYIGECVTTTVIKNSQIRTQTDARLHFHPAKIQTFRIICNPQSQTDLFGGMATYFIYHDHGYIERISLADLSNHDFQS